MRDEFKRESIYLKERAGEQVVAAMENFGAFIAGGAITSVFSSTKISDFDLFFPDVESLKLGLTYLASVAEDTIKNVNTDSALSVTIGGKRVQAVKVLTGTPESVIKSFDFTICQAGFSLSGGFVFGPHFLKHLSQRRLVFNIEAEYPICSLYRVRKFMARGFSFSGLDAVKLGLRIQSLKLDDYGELRRQLMGIDTLFLRELTDSLATKQEQKYDLNEFLEMLEPFLEKLDSLTGYEE